MINNAEFLLKLIIACQKQLARNIKYISEEHFAEM